MSKVSLDKQLSGVQMKEIVYFSASNAHAYARYMNTSYHSVRRNVFESHSPSLYYVNKLFDFLREVQKLEDEDIARLIERVKSGERSGKIAYAYSPIGE